MNAIEHEHLHALARDPRYRQRSSAALPEVIAADQAAGFDLVIVETSGIGQGNAGIVPFVDLSLYVMTPEFGAASSSRRSTCSTSPISSRSTSSTARARRTRCATCASSTSATAKPSPRHRRDAGVRHHGRALQRRRRHCAVSGDAAQAGERASRSRPASCRWSPTRSRRSGAPSCRPSAPAIWPRSPTPCATTTSTSTSRRASRASASR
jgi:hypothetical protein